MMMRVGQLRWQCYRRHQNNPEPSSHSVALAGEEKKEEYPKQRTKGRRVRNGKIGITTVAVILYLHLGKPLIL